MRKILITGGSGFIGRNIIEFLKGNYILFYPSHSELDLLNKDAVSTYLSENNIDIVIHAAIHVPMINGLQDEYEKDMIMFSNIISHSKELCKIIYFGSGAEFNKDYHMNDVAESEIGKYLPQSDYGKAKYEMNRLARNSTNIYNLRLFGVFGKYELWQIKFLSNLCCKAVFGLPLTVRSDCFFDFLYIDDLMDVIKWFVENEPLFHDYNITSGNSMKLTEFAKIVKFISKEKMEIILLNQNQIAKNYTGNNDRIRKEMNVAEFTNIYISIEKLYNYYKEKKDSIDLETLMKSR